MNTAFFQTLTLAAALASPMTTTLLHHSATQGPDHHAMPGCSTMDHDHGHAHTHEHQDSAQEGHDHWLHDRWQPTITQTDEVTAALAAGGAPVVVDVLGVVCDFLRHGHE
jgi:ABC-type Zn2+ transport system substrate-binding protein/surface adhesin